ncbi:hypothetical protein [Hymenobacter koreensis]|uniref:XRE family transcriptional regulator n=1 Tax=Hymenobacter koreensis TaxID=1084523 RepID=A0ABP8J241_9BACT
MPTPAAPPLSPNLLRRLRAWFGLSLTELGACLGLSKAMTLQVEQGLRGLPLHAELPRLALDLAQQATPAAPAPEPPDAAALRRHQRACELRADALAHRLAALPERATWARRRLAALPTIAATLAAAGAPPAPWPEPFAAGARAELTRSGSTAQALLQARLAGLRAEAAEVARLLPAADA